MRFPANSNVRSVARFLGLIAVVFIGALLELSAGETLLSKQVFIQQSAMPATIPVAANRVVIKMWGAGGGGGAASAGGGGAYLSATLNIFQVSAAPYQPWVSASGTGGYSGPNGGQGGGSGSGSGGGGGAGAQASVSSSSGSYNGIQLVVGSGGGGGAIAGADGGAGLSIGTPVVPATGGTSSSGGVGGRCLLSTSNLTPNAYGATAVLASSSIPGVGPIPGNVYDQDYPGNNVGYGGLGANGGPPAVVILAYQVTLSPTITSLLTRSAYVGESVSYQITATDSPTTFTATSLPPGLTVHSTTGLISGTVTAAGTFNSVISATNSFGTGQATLVWTVVTDITAPSVPAGLVASNLSSTSSRLVWNPSSDAFGVSAYEVKRDSVSLGTVSGTAMTLTGLSAGTTYSLTVRARDGIGNWSAWSAPLSHVQATVGPPIAPEVFGYAHRTDTTITLLWSPSRGPLPIVEYRIFRAGVEIATVSDLTYSDSGLPQNTLQSYTVRAVDSAGNVSAPSTTLQVSTTQNTSTDSDGDGIPDAMELVLGTNSSATNPADTSNLSQLKIHSPKK